MRRCQSLLSRLVMAALVSALAALLMVAVGPGFAENDNAPNENASEQAQENAAEKGDEAGGETAVAADSSASEEAPGSNSQAANAETEAAETTFDGDASSTPDQHGHTGAGTGNPEGSQADPGHKEDTNGTDGKTNGPGTGDEPADDCTNDKHQGADEPQGGANHNPGPYDNTCDGRISQNGQGDDAPGKGTPCAGCVGNADDKNPPGQVKEFYGTKKNDMGYECDGNQGVGAHYGNGNPAHTGDCATPPPCVDNPDTEMDECNPPPATFAVCHVDGNTFTIVRGLTRAQLEEHLTHPGDFEIKKKGDEKRCAGTPPTFAVCHVSGNTFTIEKDLTRAQLDEHLTHPGDFQILNKADEKRCAPSTDKIRICHVEGNGSAHEIEVSRNAWIDNDGHGHLGHVDRGDRELQPGETAEDCVEDEPPCQQQTSTPYDDCAPIVVCRPNGNSGTFRIDTINPEDIEPGDIWPAPSSMNPDDCVTSQVISICYQDGSTWKVEEDINPNDIGDFPNAKIVPRGTQASSCETTVSFCPPGTDMAGQPVPPGGISECDDDDTRRRSYVYVCHAAGPDTWQVIRIRTSSLSEHLSHGDKVVTAGTDASECEDIPETEVCPEGTDMAGQTIPADLECNEEPPETLPNRLCPADSDRPMRVIPTGQDETWCNDEVQGEVLERPATPKRPEPGDNVAPNRLQNRPETAPSRQPRGGILPFTGASVLAFLVLALQLIAAGTLILRGKRA